MLLTLDEAIKILTLNLACDFGESTSDLENALQLGIEALKVLKHGRLIGSHYDPVLIPGERKHQHNDYRDEDHEIADSLRGYWKHLNNRAER